MKLLAIDFSLNSMGIAIYDCDTSEIKTEVFKSKYTGFMRNLEIANYILRICRTENISSAIIEGYAHLAKNKYKHLIYEATGILKQTIVQEGIDLYSIPPTSVKKIIAGHGFSDKEKMADAISNKYGITFKTNDECDAYSIIRIFMNYFDMACDLSFDKSLVEVLFLNGDIVLK